MEIREGITKYIALKKLVPIECPESNFDKLNTSLFCIINFSYFLLIAPWKWLKSTIFSNLSISSWSHGGGFYLVPGGDLPVA